MDKLTYNLDQMIYHQREAGQAATPERRDSHHAEAMRHRAAAHKLDRQIKTTRQSIGGWLNLN